MSKPADADTKPNAVFHHQEHSDTAQTVGRELYGTSGVQTYRVLLATPMGSMPIDVEAATGDDAAAKALEKHPGCKVAHIAPAPRAQKAA